MNKNNLKTLAYAAWFLDGEGTIVVTRRRNRNKYKKNSFLYSILVWIYQKDWEIMDWLVWNFWWTIYLKEKWKKSEVYEWMTTHKKAEEFLKKITPFLKYKRPQAELALKFQERINQSNTSNRDVNWKVLPLWERELEIRNKMYEEIKKMKHEFKKSKIYELKNGAAVTTKCDDPKMGCDSLISQE